jgi:homoserine O-acetyltransferase
MASEIAAAQSDDNGGVGLVQTQFRELFPPSDPVVLDSGERFGPVTVAYETYGELSPQRDNAIFVCHALTGDAHVAGKHTPEDKKVGWWDALIGPGRALDTRKYFVICANVFGGCQGTTGPISINPATGRPHGMTLPFITVGDMVSVHHGLVKSLGIERLLGVIGGSLGGMQVLEWAARFPESLRSAICLAAAANLSAQGIAFNAVGRRAIYADPNFHNGDYYSADGPKKLGEEGPRYGLALARMLAHITYLSELSIEKKFGRRLQHSDHFEYNILRETEFQIESYLHHQGKRFIERFDANSYLYLTRAMDYFDLAFRYGSLEQALSRTQARFLVTSYKTDWLFPATQSREIVTALVKARRHVTYLELDSVYGHDSFLIEIDQLSELLVPFLRDLYRKEAQG